MRDKDKTLAGNGWGFFVLYSPITPGLNKNVPMTKGIFFSFFRSCKGMRLIHKIGIN